MQIASKAASSQAKKSIKMTNWALLQHKNTPIHKTTLNVKISLFNGQSFTWKQNNDNNLFYGTCQDKYFEFKYNQDQHLEFRIAAIQGGQAAPNDQLEEARVALIDYFHLDLDYDQIFAEIEDPFFRACYQENKGLRVLRQDPWECFVGFLCSQNNNLKRICMNVESICQEYGELLTTNQNGSFYTFPSPQTIADRATEKRLREIGLGYRAPYLLSSAKEMAKRGGKAYLTQLRDEKDTDKVRMALREFMGIGPKVADCISLYSLDCHNYVPVDTHMFQIYNKVYAKKKIKKMSTKDYAMIMEFFQGLLGGGYAGIAHSFMFSEKLGVDFEKGGRKSGSVGALEEAKKKGKKGSLKGKKKARKAKKSLEGSADGGEESGERNAEGEKKGRLSGREKRRLARQLKRSQLYAVDAGDDAEEDHVKKRTKKFKPNPDCESEDEQ